MSSPLAAPACVSSPPGHRLVSTNKVKTRVKRRERWCSDKGFGADGFCLSTWKARGPS